MNWIPREECLQLHNAVKKKKSAGRCLFSLQFHNQPASTQIRGYIPNRTGCVVPCHAKIPLFMRYPWKRELGKPSRCPPKTFLPVTKFLLGRKSCPVLPSAHLTSKWKVWNTAGKWDDVLKSRRRQLSAAKCGKIHPAEKSVFGGSLVLHRQSPYWFSDALSGLLAFFLLLTSSHTALLLRSSGCHSPPPPIQAPPV